jgi:hypothetical protein
VFAGRGLCHDGARQLEGLAGTVVIGVITVKLACYRTGCGHDLVPWGAEPSVTGASMSLGLAAMAYRSFRSSKMILKNILELLLMILN